MRSDHDKQKRATRDASRARRVQRAQTKATENRGLRCGTMASRVAPDDPRGLINMLASSRGRKVKVTMPKMPWDGEKEE